MTPNSDIAAPHANAIVAARRPSAGFPKGVSTAPTPTTVAATTKVPPSRRMEEKNEGDVATGEIDMATWAPKNAVAIDNGSFKAKQRLAAVAGRIHSRDGMFGRVHAQITSRSVA